VGSEVPVTIPDPDAAEGWGTYSLIASTRRAQLLRPCPVAALLCPAARGGRVHFNLGAALTQPAERLLAQAQEQVLERWRRYQHVASMDFSDQTSEDQD